jgi:DNA-binding PadR family transcriptional regulator
MSVKHAVLGLVIERPGYGYQLGQRLEERCGAWGWEKSGVYGALDLLCAEGNIRNVAAKGGSGESGRAAPRKIYEDTPKGKGFFRGWMLESSPPSPVRHELDLKILFSGPEFAPSLIDQTWAQEQTCMDELRALTSKMQPGVAPPVTWREATAVLQRDAEIKMLKVRIEWLQQARSVMKEFLDPSTGRSSGTG